VIAREFLLIAAFAPRRGRAVGPSFFEFAFRREIGYNVIVNNKYNMYARSLTACRRAGMTVRF
jgi:hypothetical protein